MSATAVICVDCGREFDPRESLMGDEGQCQMCWEAECDRAWWGRHNAAALAIDPLSTGQRENIATFLLIAGVRPKVSTGIDEQLSYGYGRLDQSGFWEFQLPHGGYIR